MSLFGGVELPDRPAPDNIQKLDVMSLPMINRMVRFGMRIDTNHFADLASRLSARMSDLRCDITNEIPPESLDRFLTAMDAADGEDDEADDYVAALDAGSFNVDSSKKMAELLYDVLGLHLSTKVKVKKTKGGDRLSTGKKTLEQLKRDHPIVAMVLEYRECSKLRGTYAVSMPKRARFHPRGPDCPECGRRHYTDERRAHTTIMSTRTTSGRLAYKNENLGNIPARTKLGAEVRAGFIPSEGYVICDRDWAQIELRLLADRSADPVMVEVYLNDGDIHVETAMRTFNIGDPTQVHKLYHRAPSKSTNFAVCYLITGAGLLDLMSVTFATANTPMPEYMTEGWCNDFIQKWFGVYSGVRRYLDAEESKIRRTGLAWTRCGRVRRIPQVRSCLGYVGDAGVREGSNHGIQGFSGDLMRLALGELEERLLDLDGYGITSFPLMAIYDQLMVETPEEHAETIDATMEDVMDNVLVDKQTGRLECLVPIKSDGKIHTERWVKD